MSFFQSGMSSISVKQGLGVWAEDSVSIPAWACVPRKPRQPGHFGEGREPRSPVLVGDVCSLGELSAGMCVERAQVPRAEWASILGAAVYTSLTEAEGLSRTKMKDEFGKGSFDQTMVTFKCSRNLPWTGKRSQ